MKKIYVLFLSTLLVFIVAACSQTEQDVKATLVLNETDLTISSWSADHSHYDEINGKLSVGDKPVVGAVVQISHKRSIDTDENGEFRFNVDRSTLQVEKIKVVSVENATVDGKVIGDKTAKSLVALTEELNVHYPITIDKVIASEENAENVDVYAHADMIDGQEYPSFGPAMYRVSGTIKDADGQPLVGATLNLRRDGVEGFSMSDPSDENGVYNLFYVPEDDENHYMFVHYQGVKYTLPARKVFVFPDDIGVTIDVTLPAEGTIIVDEPPTLVTTAAPGALYKGTMIGVNVGEDIDYTVTIPKKDGSFVVTLPKVEWEKSPTFFEMEFNHFMLDEKVAGDELSSDLLVNRKENEPTNITASVK